MATTDPGDGLQKQMYGYVVIGSKSADGNLDAMTANWGTQVSFEPRIWAVAIQADSHTRANIDSTGVFSASFMPGGTHELALKLTKHSTSGKGRLEGLDTSYFETGAPVLNSAVGWIECRVVESHQPGDHVVFFGEVIGGGSGPAEGEATALSEIGLSYAG